MRAKYSINYKLIAAVLLLVSIFALLLIALIWKENFFAGIVSTVFLLAAEIYGIVQLFGPQRIKSITVESSAIIIQYRKADVKVLYENIKKIKHYKHGPLTERILVYAENSTIYEIPFDLKDSRGLCRSIYTELSKINKEKIADEWFQREFGGKVQYQMTTDIELEGKNYTSNFLLMWLLMAVQFMLVILMTVFIWNRIDIVFKFIWPVFIIFMEYLGVLAITSPRIVKNVIITASMIIVNYKKERVEIPITTCKSIQYHRSWPSPKRVYVYWEKQYVLLPWYIKDFRGMCKSIYETLTHANMESIAEGTFQRKFGRKYR